jgi:hypothetical protein
VLVAGFAFAEKVSNVIWSEGHNFSRVEAFDENVVLDGSLFANVKAGDVLKVTVDGLSYDAADARSEAPMRGLKTNGEFRLANSAEESGLIYASDKISGACVVNIEIDEAKAEMLKADQIFLSGRNIIISKIEVETDEPSNPYFAFDGVAYIIDVESGKLVAAGHDWGTRGIVNEMGLDLIFTTNPETNMVTIDSRVSNGGNSHFLGSNLFMDAAPVEWGLLEQEFGFYITDGTKYLSVDANDNLILSDDPHLWIIVTAEGVKAQRLEEMANATAEKPASATFLIKANNFNRNDARNAEAWQVSEDCTNKNLSGGNNVNNCAESYHSVFTISQAIEGAPKGVYALTAQGFYRQDDGEVEDAPLFFANDETAAVPVKSGSENNMSNASDSFTAGLYTIDPIFVEVGEDGALTVGIKGTAAHQWVIFDNFQLTYFGPNATIDEVKNAAIYAEMNSLRDKANTLKEQVEIEAVKTALENALAETAGATGEEGINAAIEILKAAVEKAEASLTAKNVLPKMKELVESTNVYTEEALNEYYTQWEVKYLDGSLTKAEAGALQDPTVVTGWHASITCDNFLLSAWDTNPDFNDAPYYINTWSVEGDSDGSNFHVPFFEYWTGDANSLGEKTLTATMNDLPEGDYEVTAWVRVRIKNDVEAPAYGITLSVNEGEAVNVSDGDQVGTSQMFLKDVKATGKVGADGVLKIQFNVAADNNISWLSFKNVKFAKAEVVNPDAPELVAPEGWTSLISNGNLASNNVENFFSKEAPSTAIVGSTIVPGAGKDQSRGIVVKSADSPAQAWDTQFFIRLNETLPAGTKLHVEFDYVADKAAKASTQAHGEPGGYMHWACIGDVNFTTEWQHFSADVEVSSEMSNMQSIAFNLSEEATATEYRFDNFGIWMQKAPVIDSWTDLLVNGDMEGESMECFYATEQGVGGPFMAMPTDGIGVNGSKAVKVQSADNPGQDWDTQFFVRVPYQLPAGTKFRFSFDYKASVEGEADTQSHNEPGQYIHWACAGSPKFTTEWQHYETETTVASQCDGTQADGGYLKIFQTIAFNLAKNKVATEFIFDNVKFEVPTEVASTLTKNPSGITTVNTEKKNGTVYNLSGQKVQKANKGLYIINGKKIIMK